MKAARILLCILLTGLFTVQVFSQMNGGPYSMPQPVVSSGGGRITQSNYTLETIIGQPTAGADIFASRYGISNSFWSTLFAASTPQSLTLTKTAPATVYYYTNVPTQSTIFAYTIVATNTDTAATTLTIEDVLPLGLWHISAITPNGNCSYNGVNRKVTCENITLNANQSATITINVQPNGQTSNVTNTAKIISVTPNIEATAAHSIEKRLKVTTTAGTYDGTCNADCSLRDAIYTANNLSGADIIELSAGTYTFDTVHFSTGGGPNALPGIESDITILGAGAASTIIERSVTAGTPDFRFFAINPQGFGDPNIKLTINDVTLRGGRVGNFAGGAILPHGNTSLEGSLFVNNCIFSNNVSTGFFGGAIGNNFAYKATINNSTFTGNSANSGGAIYGSDITVTNSTFTNNTAQSAGGAIQMGSQSTLAISGSTFTNNRITVEGGGGAVKGHSINISNSIFNGNSAPANGSNSKGGAVYGDFVTITGSTISNNTAGYDGGGISDSSGSNSSVTVTNSTISGNTGRRGGGINAINVIVENSTVSGNSARESGGGINFNGTGGSLSLNNATITNNIADSDNDGLGQGGGVFHSYSFSPSQTMSIRNSIIAGNQSTNAPDCAGEFGAAIVSQGYNLIGNNQNCNFTPATGDVVGTSSQPIDPLLGALQNNGGAGKTHSLLANSPAIDTANPATPDGTGSSCLPTDQRGAPRPGDAAATQRCDIGAYELVNHVTTGLAFTVQPSNAAAGETITPAIQVQIQDQFGLPISSSGAVTILIGNNPGGSTMSGTLTRNAVNGVATFDDLSLNRSGAGYTLQATFGPAFVTSNAFDISPGAPHQLGFTVQPTNESVQAVLSPAVKVTIQDQLGNQITGATNAVTIAIATNPGGSTLSGTPTRSAVNGVATFNDLSLNKIGDGYTLRATAGGLQSATSDPFNITAGAPHQVAFTAQPTNTNTGQVITPAVQATVQDEWGNNLTSATNEITIALGNNPGGATLNGTLSRTAVNGVATFDDLSLSHGGNGYFLLASSNGLISGRSNTFNVIDPAVINIIEQILVTDAPSLLPSAMISVTENIAVQDAPALLPAAMIKVTEQINVLDTPALWPPVATPTGANVSVQVENVTITFHNVTAAGFTSIVPIDPASAGTLPAGFKLCEGCPAYEITTTAVYTPPVTVKLNVPSVTDPVVFSQLKMLHGENGVLVDRTTARNSIEKWVSGTVTSLSPFVIVQDEAATPIPTPTPTVSAGQVIISEFRLRGPGNNGVATGTSQKPLVSSASSIVAESGSAANDEFVEIYNATDSDITVSTTDGSEGWALAASDGVARFVVQNGTVIPARGHFLGVNSAGYSLSASAAGDIQYTTDIPDNAGIALFRTANPANFTLSDRLDAVGPTAELNELYREGAGYPAFTSADLALNLEHSFYRSLCSFQWGVGCATPGYPRDTNENAVDFLFVDTNGALTAAGQRLGAPGPENLASPIRRDSAFPFLLLDASVAASAPPNQRRHTTVDPANGSTFGTLALRRRITNNTGGPVTRLQFRIVELTTSPAPSGIADLRARTTSASFTIAGINDPNTCAATGTPITTPCMVTVQPTTLIQPPTQSGNVGGGQNAILAVGTITMSEPLQDGQSINVQFLLGVQQTGLFRFLIIIEALP